MERLVAVYSLGFVRLAPGAAGNFRCWGANLHGPLGYGHTNNIGDDETPAAAGDVSIGAEVVKLELGAARTCVLLKGGGVRCWGANTMGSLGVPNAGDLGDDELPSTLQNVDVGGVVTNLAARGFETCVQLVDGNLRCWGWGAHGELGYGNTADIGDNETPASAGNVPYL